MAKSPTDAGTTTKRAAKPKAKATAAPAAKATATKVAKATKAAAVKTPKKETTVAKPTTAKSAMSKNQSTTILQLAADIIADRIVPTIEQMKSIALSAINHEASKDKKAKKKKK